MHEQAATVSATLALAQGTTFPFGRLSGALQAIAEQSEAQGGIVGHIKAYAETDKGFAHASCTDAALGTTSEGGDGFVLDSAAKIQLVAIVMLIDLHALEHIVADSLKSPGFILKRKSSVKMG